MKSRAVPFAPMPATPKAHKPTRLVRTVMWGVRMCDSQRFLTNYRLWHNQDDFRWRSMMLFPTKELAEKEIAWFKSKNWQDWMEPFEVQLEWTTTKPEPKGG